MASPAQAPATAGGPTSHTPFPVPTAEQKAALERLSADFPASLISKLPRITCGQCRDARYKVCEKHRKERCDGCGSKITTEHIHLDYVGHADITARLLEADPLWQWEPLAFDDDGLPRFDRNGGLWIRLTVAGMTRLGYGDAQGKNGPNAVKEAIGDALRNAAMRFGAALGLWSKSDQAASKADTAELAQEPSREDRLAELHLLMQKRWGHAGGLRNVKALVDNEEFAGSLVLNESNQRVQFGVLLENRIAELEAPKPTTAADTGAAPSERPVQPPAAPPAPQEGPPSADSPETAELDKLVEQAREHWDTPKAQLVLGQIKGAAERAGLLDHNVEGPWGWEGFGAILNRRLDELKNTDDTAGRAA